jgi:hypothetical protein
LSSKGEPVGGQWSRGALLPLAACNVGAACDAASRARLLVSNDGQAVSSGDAVRFDPVERPSGVGPDEKWVLVRVNAGTLVALEGDRPIFAAPISPGVHGVSEGPYRTNPGRYRISSKAITADMGGEADRGAWRSREVPWVAYYDGSYALHGAWWHDQFGRPRSRGCVNLSPPDARWLFEWLEPPLPADWYAVVADASERPGTLVVIRR